MSETKALKEAAIRKMLKERTGCCWHGWWPLFHCWHAMRDETLEFPEHNGTRVRRRSVQLDRCCYCKKERAVFFTSNRARRARVNND